MLRSGAVITCAVAAALMSAASASAARLHVVARWSVTEKGSVTHRWSEPSAVPCDESGDGHVTVRFSSPKPGHIVIADNGYGLGDFGWSGNLKVGGTITAVDDRVRNPPAPNDNPCIDNGEPIPDKRGCGTAKLSDLIELEIVGKHFNKHEIVDSNATNSLEPPDGIPNCEYGGFAGFSQVYGGSGKVHQALPIAYPSAATLARRHGTFSVSAGDTRHFNSISTTVRQITLTFHRTR